MSRPLGHSGRHEKHQQCLEDRQVRPYSDHQDSNNRASGGLGTAMMEGLANRITMGRMRGMNMRGIGMRGMDVGGMGYGGMGYGGMGVGATGLGGMPGMGLTDMGQNGSGRHKTTRTGNAYGRSLTSARM